MSLVSAKVQQWLERNSLSPRAVDVGKTVKRFLSEMEKGLTPAGSSLPMIPTYIETKSMEPADTSVIAIDAGGTNLRISCVRFDADGRPSLESFENHPMPGTTGPVTIGEFFDSIAARVAPVAKGRSEIGFCFSFPAKIHPNKDGEIMGFDKEVKVSDAPGRMLGEGLLNSLKKLGVDNIKKVVVINDTVATALGAKAQLTGRSYSGYIGFILGTGTNTCYAEQKRNITKEPALPGQSGSMLINVESAFFDKVVNGPIDRELDACSLEPGRNKIEKMVSGAYIGEVFRRSVLQAAKDGVLSSGFDREKIANYVTVEFSEFMDNPHSGKYSEACNTEEDREVLWMIGTAIVDRAAKLAASNILAAAIKSGEGKNPLNPVFVSAEGTTMYKLKGFKACIDYHIKQYIDENQNVFIEMGKVDNTTVFGSAIAALM